MRTSRTQSRVGPGPAAAGFTLVELMVGATLSAAIMLAVISSYLYLGRGLTRLANQQMLETQARRTLGYFTQDVQTATGVLITSVTAPDFYITFTVPTTVTGVTQVTYYYSQAGTSTSIAGNTVVIPAHSLLRISNTGSALVGSPQTILSNIVDSTSSCYVRFFSASGTAYDNGSVPYTPVTTYSLGIKQVALTFQTQLGSSAVGSQTLPLKVASSRLLLRNKTFLP